MGGIGFSFHNLIFEGATVVIGGSTAGDHVVANVKKPNPSVFARLDALMTDAYLHFDFQTPKAYDFFALAGVSASAARNLLQDADALDHAAWTASDLTLGVVGHTAAVTQGAVAWNAAADAPNAPHTVLQTRDLFEYSTWIRDGSYRALQLGCQIEVAQTSLAHLQLRLDWDNGSADWAEVLLDCTDGTVNATSTSHASVTVTATVETLANTINSAGSAVPVYRLGLDISTPRGIAAAVTVLNVTQTLGVLQTDFTKSYAGTTEVLDISAPKVIVGAGCPEEFDPTGGGVFEVDISAGAIWQLKARGATLAPDSALVGASQVTSGPLMLAQQYRQAEWNEAFGLTTVWRVMPAADAQGQQALLVEFHDADSVNTYIDVGVAWAGRLYRPPQGIKLGNVTIRPFDLSPRIHRAPSGVEFRGAVGGPRQFELTLEALAEKDAKREMTNLAILNRAHRPIFCLIRPDDIEFAQPFAIYGFLDEIEYRGQTFVAGERRWKLSMTLTEALGA